MIDNVATVATHSVIFAHFINIELPSCNISVQKFIEIIPDCGGKYSDTPNVDCLPSMYQEDPGRFFSHHLFFTILASLI
ncbi:MAG: hypothetical protein ACKVGZ_11430, partial [Alphaproteobacteria bacterium]